MAGRTLERSVEDAEQAAGPAIQEQGRRIASLVPVRVPTEAQRLESTTRAAVDATGVLSRQSGTVRDALAMFVAWRQRGERAEARFQALAGGEEPSRCYSSAGEARADSAEGRRRVKESLGEERMRAMPPFPDERGRQEEDQEAVDGFSRRVSSEWMTREFLGDALFERFSASLPLAIVSTESENWIMLQMNGKLMGGGYRPGTNLITIMQVLASEDDNLKMMAHEMLHYASYLGGGGSIRWRDEAGSPVFAAASSWSLHEGATELLAQGLLRQNGCEPTYVSYPFETAVAFALGQIVGEAEFRHAYLSGDFTEVRRLTDARLGSGTFDALMGFQNAADAFSFMMEKVSAARIDFQSWEANPIMGMCYEGIAVERLR